MCESVDPTLHIMALNMRLKNEKYRRNLSKINVLLYVTMVLDPRYKIDKMTNRLTSTSGKGWADQFVLRIKDTLNKLYDEFASFKGVNTEVLSFVSY